MEIVLKFRDEFVKVQMDLTSKNIYLPLKNYCFNMPGVNVIISDNLDNYALSYIFTGFPKLKKSIVQIDNKNITQKQLKSISCYVGHSIYGKNIIHSYTVREEINKSLKKNKKINEFEKIEKKFFLTKSRLDRPLKYTGNEHWRASLAIAYAFNKEIFCFPNITQELSKELIRLNINEFIKLLREENKTIFLPVTHDSELIELADKKFIL